MCKPARWPLSLPPVEGKEWTLTGGFFCKRCEHLVGTGDVSASTLPELVPALSHRVARKEGVMCTTAGASKAVLAAATSAFSWTDQTLSLWAFMIPTYARLWKPEALARLFVSAQQSRLMLGAVGLLGEDGKAVSGAGKRENAKFISQISLAVSNSFSSLSSHFVNGMQILQGDYPRREKGMEAIWHQRTGRSLPSSSATKCRIRAADASTIASSSALQYSSLCLQASITMAPARLASSA